MLLLAATAATLCALAFGGTQHLVAVSRSRRVLTSIPARAESSEQSYDFSLHGVDLPSHVTSDVSTQLVYWADGNANVTATYIGFFNFTSHTEGFFAQLPPGTSVTGLAVGDNATTVYYADAADGSIVMTGMYGQPPVTIVSGINRTCCVAAHWKTGDLFWKESLVADGSLRDAIFTFSRKSSQRQLLYTERKAMVTRAVTIERAGVYLFWCSIGVSTQALLRFELKTKYIFNMPLESVYGDCASLAADDQYVYMLTSFDNRSNALYAIPIEGSGSYITILRPTSATDYVGITTVTADVVSSTDTQVSTMFIVGLAVGIIGFVVAVTVTTAIVCRMRKNKQQKPPSKRSLQIEVVSACKMVDTDEGSAVNTTLSKAKPDAAASESSRARANSYISPAVVPTMREAPSTATLFEPYEEPVPTDQPPLPPRLRQTSPHEERSAERQSGATSPIKSKTTLADDASAFKAAVITKRRGKSYKQDTETSTISVVSSQADGRISASVHSQYGAEKENDGANALENDAYDTASLISTDIRELPGDATGRKLSSALHILHESSTTTHEFFNLAVSKNDEKARTYDAVPDEFAPSEKIETADEQPIYDAVPDETTLQMDASRLRQIRKKKRRTSNAGNSESGEHQSDGVRLKSNVGNISQTGVSSLQPSRVLTDEAHRGAAAAVAAAAAAVGAQFLSRTTQHQEAGNSQQDRARRSKRSDGDSFRKKLSLQLFNEADQPTFADSTAGDADSRVRSAKKNRRVSRQLGSDHRFATPPADYANLEAAPSEVWEKADVTSSGGNSRRFYTVRETVFHRTPLADVQQSFRDAASERGSPLDFRSPPPVLSETRHVNPWMKGIV